MGRRRRSRRTTTARRRRPRRPGKRHPQTNEGRNVCKRVRATKKKRDLSLRLSSLRKVPLAALCPSPWSAARTSLRSDFYLRTSDSLCSGRVHVLSKARRRISCNLTCISNAPRRDSAELHYRRTEITPTNSEGTGNKCASCVRLCPGSQLFSCRKQVTAHSHESPRVWSEREWKDDHDARARRLGG